MHEARPANVLPDRVVPKSVDRMKGPMSIEEYSAARRAAERATPAASRWGTIGRFVVPASARPLAKAWLTRIAMRGSARLAARFVAERSPLRLHLGCGQTPLRGWVNVDFIGSRADLYWDLRQPLPFADATVDGIFHEHVLEHLDLESALALLRECRRLLNAGGVLRIGVPDFCRYAESLAGDGAFIERLRPGRPTRLLALSEIAYGSGHRSLWDGPTLVRALEEQGLAEVAERRFGESRLAPAPDGAHRAPETVYVEAIRERDA